MRLNSLRQKIFATSLFTFLYAAALAQGPCLLSDTSAVYRLDSHVEFFIDSSDRLSFQQILKGEFQRRFRKSAGNLTFGYLESTLWLKITTRTSSPLTRWMLEIPASFLEYVDFYQLTTESQWHHSISGYYRKHSEREFSHTGHVIPL